MNKLEELRRQLKELKGKSDATPEAVADLQRQIDSELQRVAEENKELKRQKALQDLARSYNMQDDKLQPFLGDKTKTEQDLMRALLDEKREKDENVSVVLPTSSTRDSELKRALSDALVARAGLTVADAHKDADMFRAASLTDIVRQITGYAGYNKLEMVKRAMSTSDFPVLLGNVANRVVAQAFAEAESTYQLWTTATELPDFRERTEVSRSRLSGRLKKLTEGGEQKKKEAGEQAEKFRLYSYGDSVAITREMIINDDLNAFTDLLMDFALMTNRTANGLVYDLLQSKGDFENYKMADGKAIFDAAKHNNFDSTGAKLATETLSGARTKMRRQKDNADSALNITPKYLLAAPELETLVYQLFNSEADINANQSGVANPFRGSLTPVIDAELDADPWYLAANRRTIKTATLTGTGGKPTVGEATRNNRFIELDCVFDFGLFAEDYRGLYKNAGA